MNRGFFHRFGMVMAILPFALIVIYLLDGDSRVEEGPAVGAFFGLAVLAVFCWASYKSFHKEANRPLPKDFDSDGGIDWQEKEVRGQVLAKSGEMVLLVPDAAVYEMDPLCVKLKEVGVRFKLESLHLHGPRMMDSYVGKGGLSVRMRLWVHQDDVVRAKPIVDDAMNVLP